MAEYIEKSALVAEIEGRQKIHFNDYHINGNNSPADYGACNALTQILSFIDTLEEKEFQEKNLYVVTRCEEHSDYVEKAFFSKKKAEEYCKQFEGDEDAYGRDITEIKVDCPPFEVKEVDLEDDVDKILEANDWNFDKIDFYQFAKHFFELGLKARKGE